MKIKRVRAIPVKLPRNLAADTGSAGSPARLVGQKPYRPAERYDTIYSTQIETTLVQVETEVGLVGWGEAQSPVAPEVTAAIIETLLGPLIAGEDALAPEQLWHQMYSAMRARGHGGGFYLDAIAGIDIAVWDLCGKAFGQPVCRLLGGPCRKEIPYYISGLTGATQPERIAFVSRFVDQGHRDFKLFMNASPAECLATIDDLLATLGGRANFSVDALWRLKPKQALKFADELAARNVGWLEAPLAPEDVAGHARLAERAELPIAIGESYRTRFELLPFFEQRALDIVQPDLGRVGITEVRKIAALAETFHIAVAPHVSIGLGPQIAAALHFATACPNLLMLECNPTIYEIANRFLKNPVAIAPAGLKAPEAPGLGIELNLVDLEPFAR